jgi:O-antigen ligase
MAIADARRRTRGASGSRERLAFNLGLGRGVVPGQITGNLAPEPEPSFATVAQAEPRDWGYLGLLAFTTVLLLRPQDTIRALNPLHLAEVFAIVGIAPMIMHRMARRLPVFRVTPETVALALFGMVMAATVPFSIWPGGALNVFLDIYVKFFIVFVLIMNTLTTPQRLDQITWLIVLCVGVIAARGVVDNARGVNLVEGSRLAGPVSGIFGNPNDLALNMVTFLPAAIVFALTRSYSPLRRVTAAVIVGLMLATIVFTKSRSGAVGLAAMVATLVVLGRKVRPGFGALTLAAVIVAMPMMPASFWDRMSTIVDAKKDEQQFTGSREARRILMEEAIDTFVDRPFTGVGAGQFVNYNPPGREQRWREAHNSLLQVAADLGAFGVLAFLFLIIRAGIAATSTWRMLAPRGHGGQVDLATFALGEEDRQRLIGQSIAMTAGLVGWFTCAMFASVAYNWTFYYVLALVVASRELTRHRLSRVLAAAAATVKRGSVPSAKLAGALRRAHADA